MRSVAELIVEHSESGEVSPPLGLRAAVSVDQGAADRMLRMGAYSIFDQAVVSGTSFLTTLIIARTCSQAELGVYSLAWTIVLFLTAAQGNLITVPYTVYCQRRNGAALAEYAGSTLVHQLVTSLAAVACFLGLSIVLARGWGPESLTPAVWVLLGVIPFLLLREYARRVTFAHLALAHAIAIDLIVAGLQLGALLALRWFGWLSAATAYAVMGAACGVACLYWWLSDQQPMRFSPARIRADWKGNWSFGRWALMSQLTGLAFYLLPWLLAAAHGAAETGELAACSTLVGLLSLFVIGLNNFLMPKAARAFAGQGIHALAGVLRTATLGAAVVLGGLCVVIYFVGGLLAGIMYGAAYADTGPLVTILALATLIDAMGLIASTALWAMDRPATSMIGDVAQLVVTLGVALWLVFPQGAMGVALALLAGRAAGAGVRWFTFWLLVGGQQCEPDPA
jgi:O-antigen/teichoic acid export membrane protein